VSKETKSDVEYAREAAAQLCARFGHETKFSADAILARIAELAAEHRKHAAAAAARPRGKTARERSRDGFSELHNKFAAEELEALLAEFSPNGGK
jgi:acyl-CoA reductase-like NAD-dependent aldehyde dehydrogenase